MDQVININGIVLTPLRKIIGENGNVYHGLKKSDKQFKEFGEAYFSTVNKGAVKAWKKHTIMVSNIIVPMGAIKFVVFDDRKESNTFGNLFEIILSLDNYFRLTIPVDVWFGFVGVNEGKNILLNVANIEHDPNESLTLPIENSVIPYKNWV